MLTKALTILIAATAVTAIGAQTAAASLVDKPAKRVAPPVRAQYPIVRDVDGAHGTGRMCATPRSAGYLHAFGADGYYIPGCVTSDQSCPSKAQDPASGEIVNVASCRLEADSDISTEHRLRHRVALNQRVTVTEPLGDVVATDDQSCQGIAWCTVHLGIPQNIVNPYVTQAEPEMELEPGQVATVECNGVRQMGPNQAGVSCTLRLYWIAEED